MPNTFSIKLHFFCLTICHISDIICKCKAKRLYKVIEYRFSNRLNMGVIKMAKNLDVAVLLDFYGSMLTDKQRDVIDLYYNQDLSLSEIAEHEGITRQGVRDSIKRGEVFLFELEDKLGLFSSYIETLKIMQNIRYVVERIEKENSTYHYSNNITENINQINEIIADYMKKNT